MEVDSYDTMETTIDSLTANEDMELVRVSRRVPASPATYVQAVHTPGFSFACFRLPPLPPRNKKKVSARMSGAVAWTWVHPRRTKPEFAFFTVRACQSPDVDVPHRALASVPRRSRTDTPTPQTGDGVTSCYRSASAALCGRCKSPTAFSSSAAKVRHSARLRSPFPADSKHAGCHRGCILHRGWVVHGVGCLGGA